MSEQSTPPKPARAPRKTTRSKRSTGEQPGAPQSAASAGDGAPTPAKRKRAPSKPKAAAPRQSRPDSAAPARKPRRKSEQAAVDGAAPAAHSLPPPGPQPRAPQAEPPASLGSGVIARPTRAVGTIEAHAAKPAAAVARTEVTTHPVGSGRATLRMSGVQGSAALREPLHEAPESSAQLALARELPPRESEAPRASPSEPPRVQLPAYLQPRAAEAPSGMRPIEAEARRSEPPRASTAARATSSPPPPPTPAPAPPAPPAPEHILRRGLFAPENDVMPYVPSAPCATCARGVDPLRAARVRATERGLEYFCSGECRARQRESERERAQRRTQAGAQPGTETREASAVELTPSQPTPLTAPGPLTTPRPPAPAAPRTSSIRALEPVARRIVPGRASTPRWPLLAIALALGGALVPVRFAVHGAALLVTVAAAGFVSRSTGTRERAGHVAWLAPVISVALLALAATLSDGRAGVLGIGAACAALLVCWLREHWLERADAEVSALRGELEARLTARVRVLGHDGALGERPLSSLRVGDQVFVEAGDVVPVDGAVEAGGAELLPYPRARQTVERGVGEPVLAGALVVDGQLRVRATAVGPKRALLRALSSSEQRLAVGATTGKVVALARGTAPGIAAASLVVVGAACAPGPLAHALACAGAGLLALPWLAALRGSLAALQGAILRATTRGVFYRDGGALERAGRVDTAVLRVEGALVPRAYTLVEVHALAPDITRDRLLAYALGAGAAADGDPIARAVKEYAGALQVEPAVVRRLVYTRGAGISGLTDDRGDLVLGSRAALLSAGVSVAVADREAQRAEQEGQKVVLLALGGHVHGLLVFAQEVRAEARFAMQTMFDLGLELELVSSDHRSTAEALARTLDVVQVKAELPREQREAELHRLRDGEARVASIGRREDGAGWLTGVDLGLCVEGAPDLHAPGDLRAVSYDVTTASADLRDVALALSSARAARRAQQRVWICVALGVLTALLGAFAVLPAWACALAAVLIDYLCMQPAALRVVRDTPEAEFEAVAP